MMDNSDPDKYLMAYGQHICRTCRKKIHPDDHAIAEGKQYYHVGCWEKRQSENIEWLDYEMTDEDDYGKV